MDKAAIRDRGSKDITTMLQEQIKHTIRKHKIVTGCKLICYRHIHYITLKKFSLVLEKRTYRCVQLVLIH